MCFEQQSLLDLRQVERMKIPIQASLLHFATFAHQKLPNLLTALYGISSAGRFGRSNYGDRFSIQFHWF